MVSKKVRNYSKQSDKSVKKRLSVFAVILLLVLAGIGMYYRFEYRGIQKPVASVDKTPRPITDKGSPGVSAKVTKTPDSSTPSSGTPPPASGTTSTTPSKPFGDFVSNHGQVSPYVSATTEEASVCNTSPGVVCVISFTSGSIVKSLTPKTTDSSGAAYWPLWTPGSIGLASGDWDVTATATSGPMSASTQDPTPLRVSQ